MNTITVSATHARNNFFNILNQVNSGKEIIVEKDGVKVARITPLISDQRTWEEEKKKILKVIEETRGSWKGVRFRSPLRGKKARAWLGRWDRDLKI